MAVTIAPQDEDEQIGCGLQANRKYKPQSNSTSGGIFTVMTYGYYFIWGIYMLYFPNRWHYVRDSSPVQLLHATIALYIGLIIGAIIGHFLLRRFRKTPIYCLSCTLIVLSGGLIIPRWNTILVPICASYLGGIAQGIAFITLMIHAPELAVKSIRGFVISTIDFCTTSATFAAGVILGSITSSPTATISPDGAFGSIIVIYGALGFIFTLIYTYESPVFLIKNNQEQDAFTTMKKLRRASIETWQLHQDFSELKEMIKEEKDQNRNIFDEGNMKPLLRVAGLRLLYSLSNSVLLSWYLMFLTNSISIKYGFALLMGPRCIAELMTILIVDKIGRKTFLFTSTCMSGIVLALGGFIILGNRENFQILVGLGVLGMVYELCLGIGMGVVSTVYLGEAFSLKKKLYSILVSIVCDNFIQIFLLIVSHYIHFNISAFFIVIGGLQIICGVYFYKVMPETKQLSLKECKNAFS